MLRAGEEEPSSLGNHDHRFHSPMSNGQTLATEAGNASDYSRSSSLSDLDDGPETEIISGIVAKSSATFDGDSEAETERIDNSPNKIVREKNKIASSLSLEHGSGDNTILAARMDDGETERFSDSAISSPDASGADSLTDGHSERAASLNGKDYNARNTSNVTTGKKRKRSSRGDESGGHEDDVYESPRKRTGPIKSDGNAEPPTSDEEGSSDTDISHEGPPDAMDGEEEQDDDVVGEVNDDDSLPPEDEQMALAVKNQTGKRMVNQNRQGSQEELEDEQTIEQEVGDQVDEPGESDDEADDAEAAARSEEEQAKRAAAMDSLLTLERQFAALRDRLYNERIATLNTELAQLTGASPTHPELLRQIQCIQQYRDEKFDIEQKLLVFKTGALKRKSLAERSQIHSAYFQTVRDVRERHLERTSEFFYFIQRDRFKSDENMPNYAIPFPTRRSQQITQQSAYNKEVSVLSGVAKYVGFPAAPEVTTARSTELDEDMEKMGISPNALRAPRTTQPSSARSAFPTLSRPAAEEQFLEQTPWANPQHPVHHQYLSRMMRPASAQAKAQEPSVTPASQKQQLDGSLLAGSASTMPEHPSAQVSSAVNTPYDANTGQDQGKSTSHVVGTDALIRNLSAKGDADSTMRVQSKSPSEARRAHLATISTSRPSKIDHSDSDPSEMAPQTSRIALFSSPSQPGGPLSDLEPRHQTTSPPLAFTQHQHENSIATRTGFGGIGAR